MARRQTAMRLSGDALAAAGRLAGQWAYGSRGQAAEAALLAWEQELRRAAELVAGRLKREEWNLLAEACLDWQGPQGEAGRALAARAEAQGRALGLAAKWLAVRAEDAAARLTNLVKRVESLPWQEGCAACRACLWARDRLEEMDLAKDEWWRWEFRRDRTVEVEQGGEALERQRKLAEQLSEAGGVSQLAVALGIPYRSAWERCSRAGLVGSNRKAQLREGGE